MSEVPRLPTPTAVAPQKALVGAVPGKGGSVAPTPVAPKKVSFGAALGNGLAAATRALIRATSWIFGQVASRSGNALADFRARPEHSRWRAYALGCYGLIVAATLAGQLYSSNPLGVYVKVQHVELPVSTLIFVRNDSSFAWKHARIVVNGIYSHSRDEIAAGESLPLDLDKAFAVKDGSGKILRRPPKNLLLQSLALDCDRGRYETELK